MFYFVFILSSIRANDSLKISVGYGTLFGGGLGVKYEHRMFHDKIKYHIGISGGLLPIMSYTTLVRNKNLFMLYENIDKRLVFNTEGLFAVYKNRLVIPFSLNISYNFYKNLNGLIGIGTIGRVYCFDHVSISSGIGSRDILDFFKIFSLNISTLYRIKRYFFSMSFSKGLCPLYLHEYSYGLSSPIMTPSRRDAVKNSYFINFSFGYYLNIRKIKS